MRRFIINITFLLTIAFASVSSNAQQQSSIDDFKNAWTGLFNDAKKQLDKIGPQTKHEGESNNSSNVSSAPNSLESGGSAVSFNMKLAGGTVVVKHAPIEDGAMQLRLGGNFVDQSEMSPLAAGYSWAGSCDLAYLLAAKIPNWYPRVRPNVRGENFDKFCGLNETSNKFRASETLVRFDYDFMTPAGIQQAAEDGRPIVAARMKEISSFNSNDYFIAAVGVTQDSFDLERKGYPVYISLPKYSWDKPIRFTGLGIVEGSLGSQGFSIMWATPDAASAGSNAVEWRRSLLRFKLLQVTERKAYYELHVKLQSVSFPARLGGLGGGDKVLVTTKLD